MRPSAFTRSLGAPFAGRRATAVRPRDAGRFVFAAFRFVAMTWSLLAARTETLVYLRVTIRK